MAEAERFCNMTIEDIVPICYGTNVNQKDSTRADQLLLRLVGMFLSTLGHPEPEVASGMTARFEKRWKDCDRLLFLLALLLNPFEQLWWFGLRVGINHFNCVDLLVSMWQQMSSRPNNKDTLDKWHAPPALVTAQAIARPAQTQVTTQPTPTLSVKVIPFLLHLFLSALGGPNAHSL
ncbi:hypothetical protein B0H19DRAFT_1085619 [Mycena capillaripes]|nr:hypothetical protein B0H19DRAFT_1085619 [Mycena capillaripes]